MLKMVVKNKKIYLHDLKMFFTSLENPRSAPARVKSVPWFILLELYVTEYFP